jgi:hypothetical protein
LRRIVHAGSLNLFVSGGRSETGASTNRGQNVDKICQ